MFYDHLVHRSLGNWNVTRHILLPRAQICVVGEEKVRKDKSRGVISQYGATDTEVLQFL